MTDETTTWRNRVWRWRRLIIAVVLVVGFRAALPEILRYVIASQASEATRADVTVGDVDLELYRAGIALEDVAVRARAQPGAGASDPAATPGADIVTPAADTAADAAASTPPKSPVAASAPLIAWKRLAVAVTWLPLFSKTIKLRELILESPRVDLQRLESGDINLLALVPVSTPAETTPGESSPTPSPTETPTAAADATPGANGTPTAPSQTEAGWKFGIDRFVLVDGNLRFLDRMLKGGEPVDLGVDGIELHDLALGPGVYDDASTSKITIRVDDGTLTIGARARLTDSGVSLETEVQAQRMPLRRSRLYVPNVGWSDLKGELDADLHYKLETGSEDELRGTVTLRDVLVQVPQLPDAALTWRRFSVTVDPVDLLTQKAVVSSVELAGLVLTVKLEGGARLPLLEQAAAEPPPTVAGEEPTPTPDSLAETPTPAAAAPVDQAATTPPSPAPDAAPAPPAKPWHWTVAAIKITDSRAHLLTNDAPLDVAIEVDAKDLTDSAEGHGHVNLALSVLDGSLNLDGDVRLQPPAFGGTLKIAKLPIPALIKASGAMPDSPLQSATLDTDLSIEAGLPASGETASATDVRVRGTIAAHDLGVAMPEPQSLTTSLKAVDIQLDDLAVPGAMALASGAAADSGAVPQPIRLQGKIGLDELAVGMAGTQPLTTKLQAIDFTIGDLSVPGLLALTGASSAPVDPVRLQGKITLSDLAVDMTGAQPLTTTLRGLDFTIGNLAVPGVLTPAGSASTPVDPLTFQGKIVLTEPHVTLADRQPLSTTAKSIDFDIGQLSLPGLFPPTAAEGEAPATESGAALLKGKLTLTEPLVALADGKEFSVGAKGIQIGISEVNAPGVIGPPPPPGIARPLRVALGELRFDAPLVKVTRTTEGMILPGGAPPPAAEAASPPAAEPPPPAIAPATAAAPATPNAPAPQPLDVTLATFRLTKGRVQITDRSLKPPFSGALSPINMGASDIRFPALQVKKLDVSITTPAQGTIVVKGDLTPDGGEIEIEGKDVSLAPYNPYASHYSPYRIGGGALSLKTTAKFGGGKYDTTSALTLHQFDLEGGSGDSMFQQQFGVPVSMALALMRDPQGDIAFDIPVQVAPEGTQIDIVGIAGQALRRAIVNALASPLKLLGAFGGGDKVAAVAPTIGLLPGRAELSKAGAENADRVATFLQSRPAMAVAVDTSVTADDVRWLREQALLAEWGGSGFFGKVRALAQGDTREHVEEALVARGKDEPGELSPEDNEALQKWLDERPPITSTQLEALAAARLDKLAATLQGQGIDAARIERGEVSAELAEGSPEVKIQLQPVQSAEAP